MPKKLYKLMVLWFEDDILCYMSKVQTNEPNNARIILLSLSLSLSLSLDFKLLIEARRLDSKVPLLCPHLQVTGVH